VLNPLSSTLLRWDEIRRFVLAQHGSCQVERLNGSTLKVFGIQQPLWATALRTRATREAAMIDALNRRVGERVGGGG
jgi:hypothetical protein